jgi:hypothetical protein
MGGTCSTHEISTVIATVETCITSQGLPPSSADPLGPTVKSLKCKSCILSLMVPGEVGWEDVAWMHLA